jgi:low affinity Fe/Cu permease
MNFFDRAATHIARLMGHPAVFALAFLIILLWGATGPLAGYSDTWQLIINTSTTIVTFLMVFLIQNTQNRDSHAIHLKLDELLRALDAADTSLVDLEERSEQELERLHQHYLGLAGSVASKLGASRIEASAESQSRPGAGRRNQSLRAGVEETQT